MSFSTVVGHQQPLAVLKRAIHSRRISHAYLFVGPPNAGKTLVAREFARTVNCDTRREFDTPEQVDACDECSSCDRIGRDMHPDVHLIRPQASVQADEEGEAKEVVIEGAMITTDQVGSLITEANLKATHARRKVFIVSSAEAMNPTSANRLLKTLEEPPGDTTIILTTQNLAALLPTIISRCQMLTFRPSSRADAEAALRERFPAVEEGVLRSVTALCGGRIGWALRLLDHPGVLELRTALLDLAASLPRREWFEGMAVGERLVETAEAWWLATEEPEFAERALKASRDRVLRTRMNDILDVLLTWFRDLSLVAAGGDDGLVINADRLDDLKVVESSPARLHRACADIEETRRQLRGNANMRLTAEVLAFKLISALR